jgi:hypothetical protein
MFERMRGALMLRIERRFGSTALFPALLLLGASFLAFYPGFMSTDSIDQYKEALDLQFTDWHPPLMAALWSVVNTVKAGPAGMLLLQLSLYWGALYIGADTALRRGHKLWWLWLAAGLLPCTINFAGVIWKDVGLAVSFLLAVTLLLRAHCSAQRASPVVLLLLLYGVGVRWNALPAALPIVWWWAVLRFPDMGARIRVAFVLAILTIATLLIGQINYRVLHAQVTRPWQVIMLHDIVGIGCATASPPQLPEYRNPGVGDAQLCAAYTPKSSARLLFEPSAPLHRNDAAARTLFRQWVGAIYEEPLAWAKHRLAYFGNFLRIGQPDAYYYIHNIIGPNAQGIRLQPNALTMIHGSYVEYFRQSPILKPWFWVLVSIGVIVMAARQRSVPAATVALSGLIYLAPYLLVGPEADLRYAYWTIFAALFGLLSLRFQALSRSAAHST